MYDIKYTAFMLCVFLCCDGGGGGGGLYFFFFFFNDTATTEIYTLSLHDALPICSGKTMCFIFYTYKIKTKVP